MMVTRSSASAYQTHACTRIYLSLTNETGVNLYHALGSSSYIFFAWKNTPFSFLEITSILLWIEWRSNLITCALCPLAGSGMHQGFVRLQFILKVAIVVQCPYVMNQIITPKGKKSATSPFNPLESRRKSPVTSTSSQSSSTTRTVRDQCKNCRYM